MRRTSTLLVFTLGAARESERSGLLPAKLRRLEIDVREGCLGAALEAGRDCGCRLEVCSPWLLSLPGDIRQVAQTGSGFGSRLERAMQEAFDRGASPLLVVGTDVPGLSPRHLAKAQDLLAADPDRVVLGPSPDGGLYLLAANRPLPFLGSAVRWCRRDTLRDLMRALQAAGRPVVQLEPLADLDRPADLDRWLAGPAAREFRWRALTELLRNALADSRRPLPVAPGGPLPGMNAVSAGRSPPALLPR